MSHMDENDIRPNTGTRIGYVRVSTVTQTLKQQQDALGHAGVSKTFSDTMSGARDDRPGLAQMLAYLREGDSVVVSWIIILPAAVEESMPSVTDTNVTPRSVSALTVSTTGMLKR